MCEDDPYPFCGGQAASKKPALDQTRTATLLGASGMPSGASMPVGPHLACTDSTRKGGRAKGRYVFKELSRA